MSEFGDYAVGTTKGGIQGGMMGWRVGGPWGALVGGIIGNVTGAISGISKGIREKKAKDALALSDPAQTDYLSALKRKQTALESGAYYQPEQDVIKQAGTKALDNVMKLSRGNVGTAVNSAIAVNRSTGRNLNELYGEMGMEGLKMNTLIGGLIDKMSQRKLEIQAYELAQKNVSNATSQQNGTQNLMAAGAKNSSQISDWLKKWFAQNGNKGLNGEDASAGLGGGANTVVGSGGANNNGLDFSNIFNSWSNNTPIDASGAGGGAALSSGGGAAM